MTYSLSGPLDYLATYGGMIIIAVVVIAIALYALDSPSSIKENCIELGTITDFTVEYSGFLIPPVVDIKLDSGIKYFVGYIPKGLRTGSKLYLCGSGTYKVI